MKAKIFLIAAILASALVLPIGVAVAQVTYSGAAFEETGLPNGTLWTVNCNGTYQSTTPFITISLSPGTYDFFVSDIPGYTVSPQSGTVTAIIDPIRLTAITFTPTATPAPTPTQTPTPTPSPTVTPSLTPTVPEFPLTVFVLSALIAGSFATLSRARKYQGTE